MHRVANDYRKLHDSWTMRTKHVVLSGLGSYEHHHDPDTGQWHVLIALDCETSLVLDIVVTRQLDLTTICERVGRRISKRMRPTWRWRYDIEDYQSSLWLPAVTLDNYRYIVDLKAALWVHVAADNTEGLLAPAASLGLIERPWTVSDLLANRGPTAAKQRAVEMSGSSYVEARRLQRLRRGQFHRR